MIRISMILSTASIGLQRLSWISGQVQIWPGTKLTTRGGVFQLLIDWSQNMQRLLDYYICIFGTNTTVLFFKKSPRWKCVSSEQRLFFFLQNRRQFRAAPKSKQRNDNETSHFFASIAVNWVLLGKNPVFIYNSPLLRLLLNVKWLRCVSSCKPISRTFFTTLLIEGAISALF